MKKPVRNKPSEKPAKPRLKPAGGKTARDGAPAAGSGNRTARREEMDGKGARRQPSVGKPGLRRGSPELAAASSQDPIQYREETPPKVETYLTAEQLQEFRELLLEKRGELAGDVERLTAEARKENGFNEQSTMPIHMADLGTDNWEQDFTLGLIVNEQNLVREIDEALDRIEDRTYGMCLATQKKITIPRLRAKPWAKYCIEYERAREEGRAP